jgi:hypothetical protein
MRVVHVMLVFVISAIVVSPSHAQSAQPGPTVSVPRVINISGVYVPADGQPPAGVEAVTLSVYTEAEGGTPIWQETQSVALDAAGRYTVLLGATAAAGIPADVFASGDAQWLGIVFARAGEVEGPRVRLTSVPYALRSADADTLGGRPASAFLLAPSAGASDPGAAGESTTSEAVTPSAVNPGTPNFLAKYVNGTDVGNSGVYESSGRVGVGTAAPADFMHVRFTDTGGAFTGYAVQNLGNTNTSYSGTLFYDQNGALGQFQGFNNVTHEYRINNIASGGSINFMLGGISRFQVNSSGNIGIGTNAPAALLDVSNDKSMNAAGFASLFVTTSSTTASGGSLITLRRGRGPFGAHTPVLSGDLLGAVNAAGTGNSGFTGGRAGMFMAAAENWTDTAQGTFINFRTTPLGSTTSATRMTINAFGDVGVGVFPSPGVSFEVGRTGGDSTVASTSYGQAGNFVARAARGTPQAPTAVQTGDELGFFGAGGYGATFFNDFGAVWGAFAAENWTDTAHGSAMVFGTTPLGSADPELTMGILPNGFVGIGTPQGPGGEPTATDRLQVFGDVRVGTTGTNGCVKRFDGNGLVGTCVSDRRFKRDITSFGPALQSVAALRPVHYFWRSADFPERQFGESRAYGLIAQEVEQILPDLVVTGDDGYKAVDYSKLPLLTIQAIKELEVENDALRAENRALKSASEAVERRLAELERLVSEMVRLERR